MEDFGSNHYPEILIKINLINTVFDIIVDIGFGGDYRSTKPSIHCHSYYEVFIIEEGEALLNLEGDDHLLTGGKYYVLSPNAYHMINPVDDNHFYASVFRFNYSEILSPKKRTLDYENAVEALAQKIIFSHPIRPDISLLIPKIKNEMNTTEFGCWTMINAYFELLLITILRDMLPQSKAGYKMPTRLKSEERSAIIETFFDNFRDQLTAHQLANKLSVSVRQLARIMQKIYGCSFRQKLIDMRIQEAKHLLKTTSKSIEQISCLVGYPAVQNFYRTFKAKVGFSPADYRNSL